ncbi:two-component system phosphate regulon response regulator OmpR [Neorhizobium galegae]|uniref:response regulator n=1 Tax=Neorhizobium galegae TaxID=399 RepID=UPI001AE50BE7|nr:response regulator [Neorhizobium galegae]MBP2562467.1 two-component system phosphate regulon response regulator OmpR [Neorhizobium galegae]
MSSSPTNSTHILVVDDDPRICQLLTRYFEGEGYIVSTASDGQEMHRHLKRNEVDIVLLDLSLPGGQDGLDLAREIRTQSDIPIMMLTGRGDVIDRIIGIEIGADDYIAKPFHLREVHARLKSILRRRQPAATKAEEIDEKIICFEGWTLNLSRRRLHVDEGHEVELTTGDFDMLATFAQHPGRVLTRDFLMDETRGRQLEAFDRTIDAQIVRLRRKIETDAKRPQLIKAVRGVGYIFTGKIG